ncbi:diguanylate cyclase [Anaerocolumna cellulosilytica]|uniref:Diguanylate cyclase n=1 Tax=Anaerocolumna cellulosilytica TaxID=433286 RepID=A0A6S6R8A3_9FIRM|nr:ABC transporter substrate binding protein [Anaerocolumna cellulosilytica]MBB5197889.1 diguanylate cyclase (GGDEF)-like protein [Anaerocolumna cellulosilytica]BCJ95562.1 diguanylate cyclase [Anaerocolumna cellulosilytica]
MENGKQRRLDFICMTGFMIVFASLLMILLMPRVYAWEERKRVLYISSYNENFPSVPEQIDGIRNVLEPEGVHLDLEYMDTKRFYTEESIQLFHDTLKYKMENLPPYDAILVGDDNALQFVLDYQEELFHTIPVVFLGVNDVNRAELAEEDEYITGIIEEMSIRDNIELGIKLNPAADKIVAIFDDTLTGLGDRKQFYQYEDDFRDLQFKGINTSLYTFKELEQILEEIKEDTIVLYMSMYTDSTGASLTIPEAVNMLKEHTKVPILRAAVGGVGEGILGGKMVSYQEAGRQAADIILKVFNGTPVSTISVVQESPNYYIFDYEVLQKYNIDEKILPENSTVINRKVSFFDTNKQLVFNVSVVLGFLCVLITVLAYDNIRRRKMEKELQESHEELTQTFEELTASEEELRAQYDTIQEHADEIEVLNQKYGIAIESTESAVWEYDIEKKEFYISKHFLRGIHSSMCDRESIDNIFCTLFDEKGKRKVLKEYQRYKEGKTDKINIQLPIYDENFNRRWILVRGKEVDNRGDNKILNGILLEITKMKEQEEYIEHLARHDYLTNLPNRLTFMDKLHKDLSLGIPGAILLLDIDNFKSINDTMGHIYGDKILQEIADRLSGLVDDKLFVSRFGGDEFLILLSGISKYEDVESYVLNMTKLFDGPFVLEKKENYIQFSIGITCFPFDSSDIDQLIINVDTAMYHVKRNGKNNYMFYCNQMQDEVKNKAEIEGILRAAIKEDGFELAYQPQVNVGSAEIEGFEALLRLKHYQLSPDKFIEIAEETGLIKEMGRWVTTEVIRQIADWRDKGYELKPVAINFSSKQLRDDEYVDFLDKTLQFYKVPPHFIEIEFTESILLENNSDTARFIQSFKKLGIRLALDDFGTGYSSLNYLTFIPVDKIKLDKSLCEKFLGMDNIKAMNSLIALVHSLHLVITAEGIEDIEQYERLKAGGCDYIQGYLFSKPLKKEEVEKIYNCNFTNKIRH